MCLCQRRFDVSLADFEALVCAGTEYYNLRVIYSINVCTTKDFTPKYSDRRSSWKSANSWGDILITFSKEIKLKNVCGLAVSVFEKLVLKHQDVEKLNP